MPIKAVNPDVADAINNLTSLLKRDYGCDFAYTVMGNGFVLAQHNINGVQHPIPLVTPEDDAKEKRRAACAKYGIY